MAGQRPRRKPSSRMTWRGGTLATSIYRPVASGAAIIAASGGGAD